MVRGLGSSWRRIIWKVNVEKVGASVTKDNNYKLPLISSDMIQGGNCKQML